MSAARLRLRRQVRDFFRRTGSRHRMRVAVPLLLLAAAASGTAAERHWQTGTWADVSVKRQMMDFGPGSTPFDGGRRPPPMKAMADVRIYVIDAESLRLELKDVVQVGHRSIDAVVGQQVTFAVEKNTVWIRDAAGVEHKLRVSKKTAKPAAR